MIAVFSKLLGKLLPRSITRKGCRKRLIPGMVALALLAAVGGLVVTVLGLVPIKASSGHWGITAWFLNFAKERSVATYSPSLDDLPHDDPALAMKGALHYEFGCAFCHGRPGAQAPRIPRQMTPNAPYLWPRAQEWDDGELFYIVKHGIKFTGMPAWPAAHRDDEIRAVVAFLKSMPEPDEARYLEMTGAGDRLPPPLDADSLRPATARLLADNCARCHGHDGRGRIGGAFPNLAGQRRDYLKLSLSAYARGTRASGIMEPIAAELDQETIDELAGYYSRLTSPEARPRDEDAELIERGREIALGGIPGARVPACAECHDPAGRQAKDRYPTLHGQPAEYLTLQLKLFKARHRGGSDAAHLMHPAADRLDEESIRAVTRYFESAAALEP